MRTLLVLGLASLPLAASGSIRGTVTVVAARDSSNVVVYVDRIPGRTFAAPLQPLILDQLNLTFVPHVLPVLAGTTVTFPNSDEVRHNVFSPSAAKRFNLGTYPRGIARNITFDRPGEVALLCNVHPEMSAYLIVLETPYFALTGADGGFTIAEVPAGKYLLKTWHEKSRPAATDVIVRDGQVSAVRLLVK